MRKSNSNTLPKPPLPEYDRFGFQNNLKRSDSVHWSRPWTVDTEHSRSDTEKSADKARADLKRSSLHQCWACWKPRMMEPATDAASQAPSGVLKNEASAA